jgi:hypothetical protein
MEIGHIVGCKIDSEATARGRGLIIIREANGRGEVEEEVCA